ncbi:hypothetical protein SAY87_028781 [Trapa incisa]|uniref:Thionin-like protein 2 n=1 Tax=Trapa incisa TaxID=236973 RepID=A0AAN7QPP0_9MYRT|nr:hypothetical protein SAY87_028781 [Trapa incisa]
MGTRATYKSNLALCIALVVMVMAAQYSQAVMPMTSPQPKKSFKRCYAKCFRTCVLTLNVATCFVKCFAECHHSKLTKERLLQGEGDAEVMEHFCKVGCSASLCSDISTKTDSAEVKVSDCVDSCSEKMCSNSKQ